MRFPGFIDTRMFFNSSCILICKCKDEQNVLTRSSLFKDSRILSLTPLEISEYHLDIGKYDLLKSSDLYYQTKAPPNTVYHRYGVGRKYVHTR